MTAELALLAPILMLFLLAAVGLGRYETARQEVTDAAHAGAEAASVSFSANSAGQAADTAALAALAAQPHMCPNPDVSLDTSSFVAGGSVTVTVTCRVELSDIFLPGWPSGATVRATQSAPVDPYRVVG